MLTTRFVTGSPAWTDVGTPDLDGAVAFYGGVFGWTFRPAGPGAGGYGFFQLDGRTVAGAMETPPGQGPPSWTVYFETPDAAAAAEAARRARGRVLVPPAEVRGQGTMAVLADQAGVPFGVWQPGRTAGVDAAGEPGALSRVELFTADIALAAAFYHTVLGLETYAASFPDGTHTCVNPAGTGEDAVFGDLVPLADDPLETEASWLPSFEVPDVDAAVAAVRRLGGTVRGPAADTPGIGRTARLADPCGARFAVIRSAPREA
ncbi:VOC family protein [Streptomyces sp. NPDC085946]|uniref:VOC family protein n=1 Tax=Streptomyces sp. NPDC085946 TaxID=3365744 RepID=UPI0037D5E864